MNQQQLIRPFFIFSHLVAGLLLVLLLLSESDDVNASAVGESQQLSVTYDARSLIINGDRELLFSGSIHYPRSPPEMWPDLISKAKQGGLNVIQTYVFWNIHEPVQGKYNFEGNNDLVKFIKLIGEQRMYVTLRVGPFVEAEWNHGGFPFWLREVPNITFRSDDPPFKFHMEKFVKKIINKLKQEKLFVPQGGPIILSQIENEYSTVQSAYEEYGRRYIKWAANMAVGTQTGVPWIMCKQEDAPDPVINTCNGRHCGDTFQGPNKPDKPSLWTENWTAQYRVFGDPPAQREAEDIAFSVARWFSKNGSLVNYYMYYGGTNLGRTSSSFVTTRYYDEAPLDEYGLVRGPKWGHLKDLHHALRLCKKPLLWGTPTVEMIDVNVEIRTFEDPGTNNCAAFLSNHDSRAPATVTFRGQKYDLPPFSISILPDCKTVVYNTQQVVSYHTSRNFVKSVATPHKNLRWEMSEEIIPAMNKTTKGSTALEELYDLTKDTTDYGWYTTRVKLSRYDLPLRKTSKAILRVSSLGHAMLAFVNGELVGLAHGSNVEKAFVLTAPVAFKQGYNEIALLGILVGLPNSGAYMEHRYAGPRTVSILGLNTGNLDLTDEKWGHQVGLDGEKAQVHTQTGSHKVRWRKAEPGKPLTWYKAHFDAPEGNDPVALNLTGMGKGTAWVNGQSIGRYWVSYLSPLGLPTQSQYHVPRSFIKPKKNLLVLLEEQGGDPAEVDILTVNRDTVCSSVREDYPPHVKSWERKEKQFRAVADVLKPTAVLECPHSKLIVAVEFASFGDPYGGCGFFQMGNCDSPLTKQIVEQHCLGKASCEAPIDRSHFNKGNDTCPAISKRLNVQVRCGHHHKTSRES